MRKIFSLIAVMLFAIAANAAIDAGANALSAAISAADDGATIELNSGDFTESSSITISKNITIKAADASTPVLIEGGSIYISGDVDVKFEGVNIKADGSHDAFDISAGGIFELDGCEVYNLAGRRAIKVASTAHVDAIKINNCYLHGGTSYCAIEVETNSTQNGCDLVEIKNSTFANFTLGDRAVISIFSKGGVAAADPADDVNIIVDHCTFYNCTKNNNSTYGCVDLRKSSKATVSNCIFANPSEIPSGHYASRATQLYGGTVSNCLVDENTPNHRSDDITITNPLKDVDPLFVDAANGDFTLGAGSPALTAGTDGGAIGDPFWATPHRTLYLKPGCWNADGAHYAIFGYGNGHGSLWSALMTQVGESGIYTTTIPSGFDKVIYTRQNATGDAPSWNNKWNQSPDLTVPAEKDLYIVTDWSAGTWVKKDAYYLAGSMNEWSISSDVFELEEGGLTASVSLPLAASSNYTFKIVVNGNYLSNGHHYHKDYTGASGITTDGGNMDVDTDKAGNYKFTWTFATNALNITFPSEATPITNTEVVEKAFKTIENGQIIIIKNGVRYNVLGQIEK